ncbi:MAG TPA: dockerin type I domain-containing protein [Candidatus Saccharimonadales bacterium]|nr:dockerin type I domain-containing protein [Candidatus Saccharimonadales bacterium]
MIKFSKAAKDKRILLMYVTRISRLYPLFLSIIIIAGIHTITHMQAYASGNIYGACAGLSQTEAICTDDPCGTGVATNYATMEYNGYLPGNSGACSQYCCVVHSTSVTNTPTPTTTNTPTPKPTVTPSPTITPTVTPTLTPTTTSTPTPTPTNSGTLIISVCPHGLGNCGDNVTPNVGGNIHPQHLQRPVTVTLFNGSDQQVASLTGILTYSSASANFKATISVPITVATGSYLIKIASDGLLTKQIQGITQLTSGQTATLPVVGLTTGNINNDGQLDILDYNLLINCFGSKQTTSSCATPPTNSSAGSDINDDGTVNAADYNLFLREMSVQKGS